jgi:UDP-glucose 4-epimerase
MKLLIIGSKGFIGSHVLEYYLREPGVEVWSSDVVVDYAAKNYFLIDATNADYEAVFKEQQFDVCINCVGAASVPDSVKNPMRDFYLNTKYVFDILEAIRKHSPKTKFLNLSSAAVYGNPSKLPVSEQDLIAPLSPYGWHKYQSELICREFSQVYQLRTCSLRVFSAYGPGLQKQLFWDWYQKAKAGTIEVYGTGTESRDFIFIDDLVRAIACVVDKAAFQAEAINVANGEEIRIEQAIRIFQSKNGLPFSYSFTQEVREGDPLNWRADIGVLRSFGYVQQVSFEEGIENYCRWLREKE